MIGIHKKKKYLRNHNYPKFYSGMKFLHKTKANNVIKFAGFLIALSFFAVTGYAQDNITPDSTVTDSTVMDSPEPQPQKPVKKPYERIKLHLDSITNLVTYKEIVDQTETTADSFYVRSKKWADKKYGLSNRTVDKGKRGPSGPKKIILLDKPNEKLVLRAYFDSYQQTNTYNKYVNGQIQFNLTLIFKDDKYKYIIDNIVYQAPINVELPPEENPKPIYFEYLLNAKVGVKKSDQVLKTADSEIQLLINEIKKSLQNPITIDEDDF